MAPGLFTVNLACLTDQLVDVLSFLLGFVDLFKLGGVDIVLIHHLGRFGFPGRSLLKLVKGVAHLYVFSQNLARGFPLQVLLHRALP